MAGEADAATAQWQGRTSFLTTWWRLRSQYRDDEGVGEFYELCPRKSGTQGLGGGPQGLGVVERSLV